MSFAVQAKSCNDSFRDFFKVLMDTAGRVYGEDAISDVDICAVLNSVSFVDSD